MIEICLPKQPRGARDPPRIDTPCAGDSFSPNTRAGRVIFTSALTHKSAHPNTSYVIRNENI